mmetsp:Transcript_8039/g.11067  ORF Transcript_8039/g.11067 Transcript_8039/m.11067 type:complete len:584 (-) Transcript_8039:441-2192(-)
MSFSSRRRNYLLTPHRRDGLIEWMKSMLMHSFVLDALETTGSDTFSHFEMLIDEHIEMTQNSDHHDTDSAPSRLKQLVPTVGTFHTRLPLRKAFEAYNAKYCVSKRKHVCISFNEIRHILNLAQIMALRSGPGSSGRMKDISAVESLNHSHDAEEEEDESEEESHALQRWESSPSVLVNGHGKEDENGDTIRDRPATPPPLSLGEDEGQQGGEEKEQAARTLAPQPPPSYKGPFRGPKMITFDGDQTLYSDGANFESNPQLALFLYLLLRNGVTVAVVTAAGYEYNREKYELRLSGLLAYFEEQRLPKSDCERFYLFGGECNYLLCLGSDYRLHPVREYGPGGWLNSTKYIEESPANWDDSAIKALLDISEDIFKSSIKDQKLRARFIRKKRAVGLIPKPNEQIPREALDETVLSVQTALVAHGKKSPGLTLPFCAFNGGKDAWVDVGNKRVGVQILQSYLGHPLEETLHIGDQFLNTGNDFAARDVCPCVWITSPDETTYILKSILRLAGVPLRHDNSASTASYSLDSTPDQLSSAQVGQAVGGSSSKSAMAVDFTEVNRRTSAVQLMDVYTGEMISSPTPK